MLAFRQSHLKELKATQKQVASLMAGAQSAHFGLKLNIYGQKQDTPFADYLGLAELAEKLDFEWVYVVDHMNLPPDETTTYSLDADKRKPYFLDAWSTLAAIATTTKKMRIGSQVSPFTLHHPAQFAKLVATVDLISKGRVDVGIGTGHKNPAEYEPYGLPYEPSFTGRYEMMIEGIEVAKKLWTEEAPANYSGKYYRLHDALSWPKPLQKPHPPIWLGGTSERVLKAAGRLADGWAPAMPMFEGGLPPSTYKSSVETVLSEARRCGRDPGKMKTGALLFTCISDDREEARKLASRFLATKKWSSHSLDSLIAQGSILAGNADDCLELISSYVKAGCTNLTLSFIPVSPIEYAINGMKIYKKKIFPHFQGGR